MVSLRVPDPTSKLNWLIVALAASGLIFLNAIDVNAFNLSPNLKMLVNAGILAVTALLLAVEKQYGGNAPPTPPPGDQGGTRFYCVEHRELVTGDHEDYSPNCKDQVFPLRSWDPSLPAKIRASAKWQGPQLRNPPASEMDFAPLYFNAGGDVKSQGKIGNCTGATGAEDTLYAAAKQEYFGPNAPVPKGGFSIADLYANERIMDNDFPDDVGSEPGQIGNVLSYWGICFEKDFPTSPVECSDDPRSKPGLKALEAQWKWGQQMPGTVDNIPTMLEAFREQPGSGLPRIGFPVWPGFMNAVTNGGNVPDPQNYEAILGGHEMLVIGKSDSYVSPDGTRRGAYKLQQSWGNVGAPVMPGDPRRGVFWVSYACFKSPWILAHGGVYIYQQPTAFQYNPPQPPPPPPPSPGSSTAQHTYVNPGGYTAKVTVTDANGQQQTATVQISATDIPPPPPPPPPGGLQVTLSADPASGIAPLATTLTAKVTGGTAPYTYTWNFGDTNAQRYG